MSLKLNRAHQMYRFIVVLLVTGCSINYPNLRTENMYEKRQHCTFLKSANEIVEIEGHLVIRHNPNRVPEDCK